MARLRSPSYPNASLEEAVELIKKIYEKDRHHPVSREVAAQHMGFSGKTGTSDRALSAVIQFGLAERGAKGEIRVTELATRILFPHTPEERKAALQEAAFGPALFAELRGRYPGPAPSSSSLGAYLSRVGFAPIAISPAAKAYIDTCQYLLQESAYESDYRSVEREVEAVPSPRKEHSTTQNAAGTSAQSASISNWSGAPRGPTETLILNEVNLGIRGGQVHIEALLTYEGLEVLENNIRALRLILKPTTALTPQIQTASDT